METTFISIMERFGFPVFCTIMLGWLIYSLVRWALANAAQPLVAGHLKFLDSVQQTNRQQTEILANINGKMDDYRTELQKTREAIVQVANDKVKQR